MGVYMKSFHKKTVMKLTTISLSVLLIFFSLLLSRQQPAQNIVQPNTLLEKMSEVVIPEEATNITSLDEKQGFPVFLKIPSIGVYANIQHVGFTSDGEMDVPDNTETLGWFAFGPRPGEKGSAVIAGHFFGENEVPGVFANLAQVETGDTIYVEDSKGNTLSFIVRGQRLYNPGFVLDVFNRTDKPYLNLITCDGDWDLTKESYSKRLVVFADIIER